MPEHRDPGEAELRGSNGPPAIAGFSREAIQAQLERILAGKIFVNSQRLCRFLRFTVEMSLRGQADDLKEYPIGVEVFDRRESFDPRLDPVVRSEARRLRTKLKEYYETEGQDDSILIDFPKGSYAPVFQKLERPGRHWAHSIGRGKLIVLAAAVALSAGAAVYWARSSFVRGSPGTPEKPELSIAVLPFANLSPEKDQDYFCDGFTDELTSALTKLEGLRVIARDSLLQFKGKDQDIRMIGNRLKVGAVLKGSVRKVGEKLRISAQLVNTRDGAYLWAETYERATKDLFSIQDEVSRAIVNTLRVKLANDPGRPLMKRYTESVEAHGLYLKGRYFQNQGTHEKAIACFKQAIEKDPNYAPAFVGLSDSYWFLGAWYFSPPRESMPKAKTAVLKALELDETLAEAHSSLGHLLWAYEWDWPAAGREFKRALELSPGSAGVHFSYGCYLTQVGPLEEAVAQYKRAEELDPLSPYTVAYAGIPFLVGRQYERAIQQYQKALDLDSNCWVAYLGLGGAYLASSRFDEAITALKKAISVGGPGPPLLAELGRAYAMSGRTDAARKVLDELKEKSRHSYVSPVDMASVYAALGENDRAFEYLEKAYQERNGGMVWLKVDPPESLRSDPRFTALLKKMRL